MTSLADLSTRKMSSSSVLDFNCVVGVSMNWAPPLPRSGGVGARYWEGGGWVGWDDKKEEKKGKLRQRKRRKTCSSENVI